MPDFASTISTSLNGASVCLLAVGCSEGGNTVIGQGVGFTVGALVLTIATGKGVGFQVGRGVGFQVGRGDGLGVGKGVGSQVGLRVTGDFWFAGFDLAGGFFPPGFLPPLGFLGVGCFFGGRGVITGWVVGDSVASIIPKLGAGVEAGIGKVAGRKDTGGTVAGDKGAGSKVAGGKAAGCGVAGCKVGNSEIGGLVGNSENGGLVGESEIGGLVGDAEVGGFVGDAEVGRLVGDAETGAGVGGEVGTGVGQSFCHIAVSSQYVLPGPQNPYALRQWSGLRQGSPPHGPGKVGWSVVGSHVGAPVSAATVGWLVGGFDTGGGVGGGGGGDAKSFSAGASPLIPHAGVSTQLLFSSQKKSSPTCMY